MRTNKDVTLTSNISPYSLFTFALSLEIPFIRSWLDVCGDIWLKLSEIVSIRMNATEVKYHAIVDHEVDKIIAVFRINIDIPFNSPNA